MAIFRPVSSPPPCPHAAFPAYHSPKPAPRSLSHPTCPLTTPFASFSGLLFACARLSPSAKALAVIGCIKARFFPSPPLHPARESPCAAHCTLARLLADIVHPCLPLSPTH